MSTHPPHLRMVQPEPVNRPLAAPTADAAWIEQARRGDVRAWSALYESRYAGRFGKASFDSGAPFRFPREGDRVEVVISGDDRLLRVRRRG